MQLAQPWASGRRARAAPLRWRRPPARHAQRGESGGEAAKRLRGVFSQCARILVRRRATAWLCSWHTRDSVTPSTAAISFRFMSCS